MRGDRLASVATGLGCMLNACSRAEVAPAAPCCLLCAHDGLPRTPPRAAAVAAQLCREPGGWVFAHGRIPPGRCRTFLSPATISHPSLRNLVPGRSRARPQPCPTDMAPQRNGMHPTSSRMVTTVDHQRLFDLIDRLPDSSSGIQATLADVLDFAHVIPSRLIEPNAGDHAVSDPSSGGTEHTPLDLTLSYPWRHTSPCAVDSVAAGRLCDRIAGGR